ncbi:MAG: alpha/beta hydrolase [Anaerolineales bacterium]|jgi:pimeloyl-ACP methyl ester carboxylesterase|nr:MAG: alpha/beta hydrolase [Anaerolineales bacterium]
MPYQTDLYYQAYQADDPGRKPLVLIHGAGGDHLSWPSQIRRLSGYRVYAPDLPGHGKSSGHGLQRIESYGEAVLSWIQVLELPKMILAGHSMGGAIVLWLAIHYPELVQGLVLMSTGARLPVNLSIIEELATQYGFPSAVDKICRWSFSPKIEPQLVENVKKQMLKLRPSVLAGDFRACDLIDQSGELGKVQVPTMVLVGDEDKMTPVRYSEELRDGIKGSELKLVRGSGHMLPLEKPDQTTIHLREFIDRVRSL